MMSLFHLKAAMFAWKTGAVTRLWVEEKTHTHTHVCVVPHSGCISSGQLASPVWSEVIASVGILVHLLNPHYRMWQWFEGFLTMSSLVWFTLVICKHTHTHVNTHILTNPPRSPFFKQYLDLPSYVSCMMCTCQTQYTITGAILG